MVASDMMREGSVHMCQLHAICVLCNLRRSDTIRGASVVDRLLMHFLCMFRTRIEDALEDALLVKLASHFIIHQKQTSRTVCRFGRAATEQIESSISQDEELLNPHKLTSTTASKRVIHHTILIAPVALSNHFNLSCRTTQQTSIVPSLILSNHIPRPFTLFQTPRINIPTRQRKPQLPSMFNTMLVIPLQGLAMHKHHIAMRDAHREHIFCIPARFQAQFLRYLLEFLPVLAWTHTCL